MNARNLPAIRRFALLAIALAFAAPGARSQGAAASPAFTKLAEDYWAVQMRLSPLSATYVGYPGYDDRLDDIGPTGRAARAKELGSIYSRLLAIDTATLSASEEISWEIMKLQIDMRRERDKQKFWEFDVDHIDGPQAWIPSVIETAQPMKTEQDAQNLLKRLYSIPLYFKQQIGNLREGLRDGRVAARVPVVKTIAQLQEFLDTPAAKTPFAAAALKLPAGLQKEHLRRLLDAIEWTVKPGLRDYKNFLETEYLPRARPDDKAGLCFLPGGREAYRYEILDNTTLDKTAEEIHQTGLEELSGIRAEMEAVKKELRYKKDLPSFLQKIRKDRRNFFKTREEIVKSAQDTLARFQAKLPAYFNLLPKTPLIVKPMEAYREKTEPAAEYYPPPDDLSRPGVYYVNTYKPETRDRFGMASTAAHEGVPGHHLQMALAIEQRGLPAFRRNAEFTAYVEGWALYSERLADEMGLYRDPLERLGMLSNQAFRACRLVVDTGLHAEGWSRQQAIDFMKANTLLSDEDVETEVDRYIVWPGQALAYKMGQREILSIRKEAQARLGPRFDLRAFHDAVLKNGAVPLPTLRRLVLEGLN